MLECSMLQYITYTLLPVHLFPSFFVSPPILFSPVYTSPRPSSSRSIAAPISLPLRLRCRHPSCGGTESRCIRGAFIPSSWQTRKRALHRHRKISSALDFWQTAALASSTILNPKFVRFYVRLHDTRAAFVKRKEP